MAKSRTIAPDDCPSDSDVPEGWEFVDEVKKNGTRVKYYTNILRQKFYSKSDLKRNIDDAKKRGLSIYAPDFQPPIFRRGRKPKLDVVSPSNKKEKHTLGNNGRRGGLNSKSNGSTKSKKQNELENHNEIECASALIDLSIEKQNEERGATALLQISAQSMLAQSAGNIDNRSSRRLAGLGPELQNDFMFTRALEYIIKEKGRL